MKESRRERGKERNKGTEREEREREREGERERERKEGAMFRILAPRALVHHRNLRHVPLSPHGCGRLAVRSLKLCVRERERERGSHSAFKALTAHQNAGPLVATATLNVAFISCPAAPAVAHPPTPTRSTTED